MPTGIEIQEEATANMPSKEWKQKRYKKPWVQGDTISVGIAKLLDSNTITSGKSHLDCGQ